MAKAAGPIPVAVMGLGFIGQHIAKAASSSEELTLVAAIDSAPGLVGKPLAELVPGAPDGVAVEADLRAVLPRIKGGVLLHAAGSRFLDVLPDLEACARAGVHVVSTCEELAFPWVNYDEEADKLDALAAANKATILGTGINPGFVLDRLIATVGGVCGKVTHCHAERVVDARTRRAQLQKKVGAGLTEAEFEKLVEDGKLGHVGLAESAALAAIGLGLDYDEIEEEIAPVLAEADIESAVPVRKGQVAGVYQRVRGFLEGREVVDLELTIAVGMDASYDRIHLDAEPPVDVKVEGGYAGDSATAWAVVNAAPRVARAEPGILTVLELPAGR